MRRLPFFVSAILLALIFSCITSNDSDKNDSGNAAFTVSGTILDSEGAAVTGATVAFAGQSFTMAAETDSSGNWSVADVGPGTYTITPVKEGVTFTPPSTQVTVTDGDVTVTAFVGVRSGGEDDDDGQQVTDGAIVSGRVVNVDGHPEDGVVLSISNLLHRYEDTTDSDGMFSFTGVADGVYNLVQNKQGREFIPSFQTVTVSGGDVRLADIVCAGYSETAVYVLGRVITPEGAGVGEVTASITNLPERYEAESTTAGYFLFEDVAPGTYGLVTNRQGMTFTPDYQTVAVSDANVRIPDIIATPRQNNGVTVTGRLIDNHGVGIADATLSFTGSSARYEATSSAQGYYVFDGVVSGSYGLVVNKQGYTFEPSFLTVVVETDNVALEMIVGSVSGDEEPGGVFTVSGHVYTKTGGPFAGVTVILGGERDAEAVTDENGYFRFGSLMPGQYMAAATKAGTVFTPYYQMITIIDSDLSVDFRAYSGSGDDDNSTYVISGLVTSGDGGPVAGVTLTLAGGAAQQTAETGDDGVYRFDSLANGFYTVIPVKEQYTFTPPLAQVTVNGANVTQHFTAAISGGVDDYLMVTGYVIDSTGNGIADVTVTARNTRMDMVVGVATTDVSGRFSFDQLFGGIFNFIPARDGYSFEPASRSVILESGNTQLDAFVGTPDTVPRGDVSGKIVKIYAPEEVIEGVRVKLESKASGDSTITTTGEDGVYSFSDVADGEYRIVPTSGQFIFDHRSRSVTCTGTPVADVNFKGGHSISGHAWESQEDDSEPVGAGGVLIKLKRLELSGITYAEEVTDAQGAYCFDFTPLVPAEYRVEVDDDNFEPQYYEIEIVDSNLYDLDFTKGDGGSGDQDDPDDSGGGNIRNFWLEITDTIEITEEGRIDATIWKGNADFTLTLNDDGMSGPLKGGGELKITGGGEAHDDSEDSNWSRTGTVTVNVSGQYLYTEDPKDGDRKAMLNIALSMSAEEKITITSCDKDGNCETNTVTQSGGGRSYELLIPAVDGYTLDNTINPRPGVTGHSVYVLHFGGSPD